MSRRTITNSRVLVTGGAGFIGSNLIEALLRQDNQVVCLDNLSAGKAENIASFKADPAFTMIEGDIRSQADCRKACDGVDYVLHHAALGSVPHSIADPVTTDEVNINGFVKMLVAARDAGVKRFVYASSSSVYGDSETLPKKEDDIGRQLSPYAITKYVNELYAGNFADIYGMETVGLRYFNVFGRRQDPFGAYAAVIPLFVMKLMKHEPPVINGDGSYSRDFTYIENVVQANQLAAVTTNAEAVNTAYNIAYGVRCDLKSMYYAIRDRLAEFDPAIGDIEPEYGPFRVGDIPHSLADISKAKSLLGYDPAYDFTSGLSEAAEWYWNNLMV